MARPAPQRLQLEAGYMTCKACNRLILAEHADEDGNCSLHEKSVEEAKVEAKDEAPKTGYSGA